MRRQIRDDGKYNLIERHRNDPSFKKPYGPFKGRDLDKMREIIARNSENKDDIYFETEISDLPLAGGRHRSSGKVRTKRR